MLCELESNPDTTLVMLCVILLLVVDVALKEGGTEESDRSEIWNEDHTREENKIKFVHNVRRANISEIEASEIGSQKYNH